MSLGSERLSGWMDGAEDDGGEGEDTQDIAGHIHRTPDKAQGLLFTPVVVYRNREEQPRNGNTDK